MSEIDHSKYSTLRELIVEHLFVGEMLRRLWQLGVADVEVLRSESDSFGYDLVVSRSEIVRHIQLKTVKSDGKADEVKISIRLMDKPSVCVIWIVTGPGLSLDSFLWFGGSPCEPLPNVQDQKIAKHTKGNSSGRKNFRPDHRIVKRTSFEKLADFDRVLFKLFGQVEPGGTN